MLTLPSPLHPAVVHFPIVLILLGSGLSVFTVFVRRWHLPWLVAIVLAAGSGGGVVATWTGEEAEESAESIRAVPEALLHEHQEWGEAARNLALVAAAFAIASAAASKVPMFGRGLALVAAVCALAAAYSVGQAGHLGGELVYRHGVGVENLGSVSGAGPEAATKIEKDGND
ncbi:MAG: hypothetical protein RIR25_2073 [Verrucomicrobiota bacterium]|jgi:uncharacterized membrane protein